MIQPLPLLQTVPDVIRAMNDRIRQINTALGGTPAAAVTAPVPSITYGTHAARLGKAVTDFPSGSIFVETDRGVTYQIQNSKWAYTSGVFKAAFAAAPTGLASADTGYLWNVSDYAHLLRWTGGGWEFVDAAGGYIVGRVSVPDGPGWQFCDGTATHYLHIAAGVVSETAFTPPTLTGAGAYLKLASPFTGSIVAATAPGQSTSGRATGSLVAVTLVDNLGEPAHLALLAYFRR